MAKIVAFALTLMVYCVNFSSTQSESIINKFEYPRGKEPFSVYWNVPTFQCRSKKVFFEELNAKYGIITNTGGSFKGDKMVIMYDPGNFPAIFETETEVDANREIVLRNGGVPQAGNLSEHLEYFKQMVDLDFPNKSYDGLAVIDFESWRPVYRQNWGSLLPYKELSIDIERQLHPSWCLTKLKREAEVRFETEGRKYVEETLRLGKEMRPNATWGYYAYPYCFNMQSPDYVPDCTQPTMDDNDRLSWMFEASDSLHPSVYLPEHLTMEQRRELMEGRVFESVRIRETLNDGKQIYPYFWLLYRDTKNFIDEEDLYNALDLFKSYGTNGMIIWGSSTDVNTKPKCEALYNFVDLVLGPALLESRN